MSVPGRVWQEATVFAGGEPGSATRKLSILCPSGK